MRILTAISTVAILLLVFLAGPVAAASVNDFQIYNLVDESNVTRLLGRLHVPTEYAADPTTPRPLILFLHGSGESGTNNVAQINGNIDNLLTAAKARDAFLYAPQTNSGWENPILFTRAMTMIDRAIADLSVDPEPHLRHGTLDGWRRRVELRQSISRPCGRHGPDLRRLSGESGFQPSNIVNEPIWAFHGRNDTNVPVQVTRDVVNSLLNEAGLPIPEYPPTINNVFGPIETFDNPPLDLHYTDYRGGHGIWPQVYNSARFVRLDVRPRRRPGARHAVVGCGDRGGGARSDAR